MTTDTFLFITNHENGPVISADLASSLAGVAAREETNIYYASQEAPRAPFYCIEDIRSPFLPRQGRSGFRDIEAALKTLLTNTHSFYILDRVRYFNGGRKTDLFRNSFNQITHLQQGLLRVMDILEQARPRQVFFTSTPHDIESWLFFICAHHKGLRILVASNSALPWRLTLKDIEPHPVMGYRTLGRLPAAGEASGAPLSEDATHYIAQKRGDYADAEPGYMKRQKSGKKTKPGKRTRLQKWRNSILKRLTPENGEQPERITVMDRSLAVMLSKLKNVILRSQLRRYATQPPTQAPFIALFLHYQPERTSVPEGGFHGQQIIAIEALRDRLPPGWHLVVKEHPSIFMLKKGNIFRHPAFYRTIAAMEQVNLVGPEVPSFDLIDQSRAVATLTGTVGFEALCRGTPAIALGDAAWRSFPGVIDYYHGTLPEDPSEDPLDQCIQRAQTALDQPQALEQHAAWLEQNSLSDDHYQESISIGTMTMALEYAVDSRIARPHPTRRKPGDGIAPASQGA